MVASALLVPRAPNVSVCSTPECIKTAQEVLAYVDLNVDPCSDFYQYTCGSWLKNNVIPDNKSSNGSFEHGIDKANEAMRVILEGTYEDFFRNLPGSVTEGFHLEEAEDDKKSFETIQEYYNLCIDENTLNDLGSTPIYPDIALIENELFPINDSTAMVSSNNVTNLIVQTMALLQLNGIGALALMYVFADDKNPNMTAIYIDQAKLTMPAKEYYSNPEYVELMRTGLNDILFKTIGEYTNGTAQDAEFRAAETNRTGFTRWNQEKIKSAVDRYVDFESKLANISLSAAEKQDRVASYNPIALSAFQNQVPTIDWINILNAIIPEEGIKPEPNTTVINRSPQYFQVLNELLTSNVTLQTLQEYLTIQYVLAKISSLDAASRNALSEMEGKIKNGATAAKERWRECITITSNKFPHELSRYYVLKEFGGEAKRKKVEDFITTIHDQWLHKLENIGWLDNETKANALDKVKLIRHKTSYPIASPDIRSPFSLKEYNQGISINKTSFYDSAAIMTKFNQKVFLKMAGKKMDKDMWLMPAQTVNAYYSANTNEIVVPAGIYQSPFNSFDSPEYLNYGGIGMIIGHEITHAFDSIGRSYNGNGLLIDWWTNTTTNKFVEISQCFIDQYSKFNVTTSGGKTFNVNGNLTLSENIADNGGLSASYLAYQTLRANKASQRLQGLEQLSPEALFFVNFGRIWCSEQRDQIAEQLIYTDTHSPSNARVNGAIQNSEEFATVFNCPVGSPMNPEKKCKMW